MFDVTFFIGRFQPFHEGHKHIVEIALQKSQFVVVGLGSANRSRSIKNPFTAEEREEIIRESFNDAENARIYFAHLDDYLYDDTKWLAAARTNFNDAIERIEVNNECKFSRSNMALIGHEKDGSSFYLKMFPELKNISVKNHQNIDATYIRNAYFDNGSLTLVPQKSANVVGALMNGSNKLFENMKAEFDMIKTYKKSWEAAPYPPTFMTTDAVVTCSGHILLVERGAAPGKGLVALPGGFLDQNETLQNGMIRELREETKLKVPEPVLIGNIKSQKIFDHPSRSLRGRTITTAFHIDLGMQDILPRVKGSDDAAKAFWLPINEINPRMMFEDHFDIISHFTGV